MKKKLIVFTYDSMNSVYYLRELMDFFGNQIEIEAYAITDGIEDNLKADVILTLSPMNNDEILCHFSEEPTIIHGLKVITNYGYRKLMEIIPGTKVLLITTNRTSAFEMAAYFYQIGINHIDFIPSYPNNPENYSIDIAVTPGQMRFIPVYIRQVIDIGWRRISPDTLMSIMVALNIKTNFLLEKLYQTSKDVLSNDFSNAPLDLFSNTKDLLYTTINLIDDGLLFSNTNNTPLFVNNSFLHMMNLYKDSFDINNLIQYLPAEISSLILSEDEQNNYLVKLEENGQVFAFTKHAFSLYKDKKGFIVILKDSRKIEYLEHEIRKKSLAKNTSTKYQFSDIVGNSTAIKKCIQNAKRMALTNLPILIMGESGTGKELLAQSIHHHSTRCDKPFVALNCASFSKELLESELFGYEEGSFTGAKKGGKKGLFELAQNGTIFLDEIGEMPFELQAKLLRVLQEQEIRKIGSTTTISIDVRIITATNRDLSKMMDEGLFRLDLFYRISMFSLVIPPLRERKEDIPILAEYFLKTAQSTYYMDDSLKSLLLSYPWKGNIRELKNCIEYMTYMGSNKLTPDDLPPGYSKKLSDPDNARSPLNTDSDSTPVCFQELCGKQQELCYFILNLLFQHPMGRIRILKELDYKFTEHEIKKTLQHLTSNGYIYALKGRGGTTLTSKGLQLVHTMQQRNPKVL